jgi:hypothetical protein
MGAAAGLFADIGMAIPEEELAEHDKTLDPLRAELGDALAGYVEEGRASPRDYIVDAQRVAEGPSS